jgi:hypothetical protein
MTVFEGDRGIMATCHRDACSVQTISLNRPYDPSLSPEVPARRNKLEWRELWDNGVPVPAEHEPRCMYKYADWSLGLHMRWHEGIQSLLFPVWRFDPSIALDMHAQYGVVIKRMYGVGPKSLFIAEGGRTGLAWFVSRTSPSPVVCVEDCLSAIALREHGVCAVSLNGTHINEDRFSEIRKVSPEIIVALDADATRTAARHVMKFRSRANISVRRLDDDIKDMDIEQVRAWVSGVISDPR